MRVIRVAATTRKRLARSGHSVPCLHLWIEGMSRDGRFSGVGRQGIAGSLLGIYRDGKEVRGHTIRTRERPVLI